MKKQTPEPNYKIDSHGNPVPNAPAPVAPVVAMPDPLQWTEYERLLTIRSLTSDADLNDVAAMRRVITAVNVLTHRPASFINCNLELVSGEKPARKSKRKDPLRDIGRTFNAGRES